MEAADGNARRAVGLGSAGCGLDRRGVSSWDGGCGGKECRGGNWWRGSCCGDGIWWHGGSDGGASLELGQFFPHFSQESGVGLGAVVAVRDEESVDKKRCLECGLLIAGQVPTGRIKLSL